MKAHKELFIYLLICQHFCCTLSCYISSQTRLTFVRHAGGDGKRSKHVMGMALHVQLHILCFTTNGINLVQFIIFEKTTGSEIGTFISICCCHSRNIFKAHLFLYFVEDGTASSARTCSSDALFGKRKRLGLPLFFSAITIRCNETLPTCDKRLSKYRQRLA